MMQDQVTVVIPAWNAETFLQRAVESVVDQTVQPNMIVVVDDGSTDSTLQLAIGMGYDMKEVVKDVTVGTIQGITYAVITKPHRNPSSTRNMGIRFAQAATTIFAFLDADDWYGPRKIQRSLEAFRLAPEVVCVVSDYDDNYVGGKSVRQYKAPFDADRLTVSFLHNINCLIRRTALDRVGLFDEEITLCEDYDLVLRLSEVGLVYHIPEVLHHRSEHPASVSRNVEEMLRFEMIVKQKTMARRRRA